MCRELTFPGAGGRQNNLPSYRYAASILGRRPGRARRAACFCLASAKSGSSLSSRQTGDHWRVESGGGVGEGREEVTRPRWRWGGQGRGYEAVAAPSNGGSSCGPSVLEDGTGLSSCARGLCTVTQSLLQSLELVFVHRSLVLETHEGEDSQLAAAELRRLSVFKRELEVSRGKVCLCRGWLQNPVLPGVCVCV